MATSVFVFNGVALEDGGAAEEGDGDDCRFHDVVLVDVFVICDYLFVLTFLTISR